LKRRARSLAEAPRTALPLLPSATSAEPIMRYCLPYAKSLRGPSHLFWLLTGARTLQGPAGFVIAKNSGTWRARV
jgi:hypothetical protein